MICSCGGFFEPYGEPCLGYHQCNNPECKRIRIFETKFRKPNYLTRKHRQENPEIFNIQKELIKIENA